METPAAALTPCKEIAVSLQASPLALDPLHSPSSLDDSGAPALAKASLQLETLTTSSLQPDALKSESPPSGPSAESAVSHIVVQSHSGSGGTSPPHTLATTTKPALISPPSPDPGAIFSLSATTLPIHKLPVELLTAIFCLASQSADINLCSLARVDIRWVISQVCSHWRSVMLSAGCAPLWARLDLGTDIARASLREPILLLECMIQRARGRDLNIFICDDGALQMLNSLAPYASQWSSFQCFSAPVEIGQALSLAKGSFPRLKRLALSRYEGPEILIPDGTIETAPLLHSVTLSNFRLNFPRENLIELEMLAWHPKWDLFDILQASPNLRRLDINDDLNPEMGTVPNNTTLAPTRRRMVSHTIDSLPTVPISSLAELTLPNLRTLCIGNVASMRELVPSNPFPALLAFLERSQCPLHELVFHDHELPEINMWGAIFALTPRVFDVRVTFSGGFDVNAGGNTEQWEDNISSGLEGLCYWLRERVDGTGNEDLQETDDDGGVKTVSKPPNTAGGDEEPVVPHDLDVRSDATVENRHAVLGRAPEEEDRQVHYSEDDDEGYVEFARIPYLRHLCVHVVCNPAPELLDFEACYTYFVDAVEKRGIAEGGFDWLDATSFHSESDVTDEEGEEEEAVEEIL